MALVVDRTVVDRVWGFAVVSSAPQDISLDAQVNWIATTAKAQGWTVSRVFRGVSSGKSGTRKLLDDVLTALRAAPKGERPRRLLMVRIDRLGRGSGIEAIAALAELKRLGVSVWTRDDGDVRIDTASDAVLPAVKAIVAAIENEVRADRVRAGQARRRAAGKHLGAVPYGTVLVDGKPVAYEPEAVIVREIFELLAAGWGLERIAGHVRPKAPPKRLHDGGSRPMTWGRSSIRSVYRSEVVRSVVVDEMAIARAERARRDNYRFQPTGEWEWPLRGAIHCTCGHLLIGHATGTAPNRIRYYRCRSHPYADRGPGNTRPGHRADALEASFVGILKRLAANPAKTLRPARKNSSERLQAQETSLRAQLSRLDRRRRRACELAEDGAYSGKELRERLDRIDTERRALAAQIEETVFEIRGAASAVHDERRLIDVIASLPRRWPRMPIADRQQLAKAVSQLYGGLTADPKRPGELAAGSHVATRRKVRVNSQDATRDHMFVVKLFTTGAIGPLLDEN